MHLLLANFHGSKYLGYFRLSYPLDTQQVLLRCHHQPIEPTKPVYHFSRKGYGIDLS
jgi:hypothetical protein